MANKILHFLKYNKWKKLTIYAWLLTAYYRFTILVIPASKLEKRWGRRGEESSEEITRQQYIYAKQTSWIVNYVAWRTPWESKCLVRALTAQHILKRRKVSNTLYLGVGKDEGGAMIAHSWIRCGRYYVSGGDGAEYTMVAKFAN